MLSILSLVVPSTSSTIDLSSLIMALNNVDLPAFGLPRIHMPGTTFSSYSPITIESSLNLETNSSKRSPVFIPCTADIFIGYPKPNFKKSSI